MVCAAKRPHSSALSYPHARGEPCRSRSAHGSAQERPSPEGARGSFLGDSWREQVFKIICVPRASSRRSDPAERRWLGKLARHKNELLLSRPSTGHILPPIARSHLLNVFPLNIWMGIWGRFSQYYSPRNFKMCLSDTSKLLLHQFAKETRSMI